MYTVVVTGSVEDFRIVSIISFVRLLLFDRSRPATPATKGHDIDVPDLYAYESIMVLYISTPGAAISVQ